MRIFFLASASIFLLSLLRPDRCQASDPAVALSRSEGWLRLGHYQRATLGGYSSRVASDAFFLSPYGRSNPEQELRATIEAFRSPGKKTVGVLAQSPECAFPARRAWLVQQGVSLPEATEPCADREEWAAGIGATGATLVYSSAYPNNPASMFGHSLLMLNHASGEPLLNYGVNFEARVDPADGSFAYGLKGLLGLYPGEFSISPYYTKINEYNYSESRDLWEYELNLSPQEVHILMSHLWELFSTAGFRYYFLDDNCSFQLMALLEVVKPEWSLTRGYGPYTLPLDTIKKVAAYSGAIRGEKLRPSLGRRMNHVLAQLSSGQEAQRKGLLEGTIAAEDASDVAAMESVLVYLDYLRRKEKGLEPKYEKLLGALLLRRSKLVVSSPMEEVRMQPSESPLGSHASHALFPGMLLRDSKPRFSLGARMSLHDILDPAAGFPDGFGIDFARVRLTYGLAKDDHKLRLEEFQLIDILSLYQVNSADPQISWMLRAGSGSRLDHASGDSLGNRVEGGPGFAAHFERAGSWIYALGLLYGEHLPNAPKHIRYGAGGEAGVKLRLFPSFQLRAATAYRLELNRPFERAGFFEHAAEGALTLGQNWQLRVSARTADSAARAARLHDVTSDLRWYF